MPEYIKGQLLEQYDSLDEGLQKLLDDKNTQEKIRAIGQMHNLTDEEIWTLVNEVGYVLFGLSNPNNLVENLKEGITIPDYAIQKIVNNVDEKIFTSVRESLNKLYNVPVSPPPPLDSQQTEITKKDEPATLSTVPTPQTPKPPEMPELKKDSILREIEEPRKTETLSQKSASVPHDLPIKPQPKTEIREKSVGQQPQPFSAPSSLTEGTGGFAPPPPPPKPSEQKQPTDPSPPDPDTETKISIKKEPPTVLEQKVKEFYKTPKQEREEGSEGNPDPYKEPF